MTPGQPVMCLCRVRKDEHRLAELLGVLSLILSAKSINPHHYLVYDNF